MAREREEKMTECGCEMDEVARLERRTLWALLAINGFMFFGEGMVGWLAESAGLLADSLDMLADASVYAIALYAVGRHRLFQASGAGVSGVLQIGLGLGVMFEVMRRWVYGSEPVSELMMIVGCIALAANVSCLVLIAKHRRGGVHMRASWIFSANDVIANIGVIISGGLVMYLGSRLPDLIVGAIVSIIVLRGGFQIMHEAKEARSAYCK